MCIDLKRWKILWKVPMCVFAVIHQVSNMVHACNDLSKFLTFCRSRNAAWDSLSLIGIWLEPDAVTRGFSQAMCEQLSANRRIPIRETIGLSDIWTLCRPDGDHISRFALLDALMNTFESDPKSIARARFIPVFHSDEAESHVQSEVRKLKDNYPVQVLSPQYQNPITGGIIPTVQK